MIEPTASTNQQVSTEKETNYKLDYTAVKYAAHTLRAVNHQKVRQKMLKLIEEGNHTNVTDLYVKLRLEQSVASQHLAILRHTNVVKAERKGKEMHYTLNHDRIAAISKFASDMEYPKEPEN